MEEFSPKENVDSLYDYKQLKDLGILDETSFDDDFGTLPKSFQPEGTTSSSRSEDKGEEAVPESVVQALLDVLELDEDDNI